MIRLFLLAFAFLALACGTEVTEPTAQGAVAPVNFFRDPVSLSLDCSEQLPENEMEAVLAAVDEWSRAIPYAQIVVTIVPEDSANVTHGRITEWVTGRLRVNGDGSTAQCLESDLIRAIGHGLGAPSYYGDALDSAPPSAVFRDENGCSVLVTQTDLDHLRYWRDSVIGR